MEGKTSNPRRPTAYFNNTINIAFIKKKSLLGQVAPSGEHVAKFSRSKLNVRIALNSFRNRNNNNNDNSNYQVNKGLPIFNTQDTTCDTMNVRVSAISIPQASVHSDARVLCIYITAESFVTRKTTVTKTIGCIHQWFIYCTKWIKSTR